MENTTLNIPIKHKPRFGIIIYDEENGKLIDHVSFIKKEALEQQNHIAEMAFKRGSQSFMDYANKYFTV